MNIREATPGDAPAMCTVHRRAIETFGPAAYDDEQVAAWRRDRHPEAYELGAERLYFVVLEAAGEIHGFGALNHEPGDHLETPVDGEVTALYVHPDAARQGVGSALLGRLEREARDHGYATLGLWSSLNAVGFYRAQGYERVTDHCHEFADGVTGRVVETCRTIE